ncbi:MAG: glycosyltransferase family A protein [Gemmatimonadaceae bacterium]
MCLPYPVVAVRNQERFIGRCVRSILNQTYARSDFEVIVVNDASADRTRYALELFEGGSLTPTFAQRP